MNNAYHNKDLGRKAQSLQRYRTKKKIIIAIILLIATVLVATYIAVSLYNRYGSFTITIKRQDMARYGLTLGESPTSLQQISRLNAEPLEDASESTADWIDEIKEIDSTPGSHNGTNYMAYTFYCINASDNRNITYSYTLVIKNVVNNLDEAIRVKVYVNGEVVGIYGKQDADGSTPLRYYEVTKNLDEQDRSESNLINKFSTNIIMQGEIENLKPKESTKFTVVMWIEGTDPDCTNDKMGGKMRVDMNMSVLHAPEIEKN